MSDCDRSSWSHTTFISVSRETKVSYQSAVNENITYAEIFFDIFFKTKNISQLNSCFIDTCSIVCFDNLYKLYASCERMHGETVFELTGI